MTAIFSPCRRYRYVLTKRWLFSGPLLVVIGHNPSTAGQIRCPRCQDQFVPYEGLEQACPKCEHGWTRPGDGGDELLDPTVAKVEKWARRDGFSGWVMLNLCARIGTDPNSLTLVEDPVGPDNDAFLLQQAAGAGRVVAAWGGLAANSRNQRIRERPLQVVKMLAPLAELHAFRLGVDGTPYHPLYLPLSTTSFLWRERDRCAEGCGRARHGTNAYCEPCLLRAAEHSKRLGFV